MMQFYVSFETITHTCAIPDPIRPPPITVTCLMASAAVAILREHKRITDAMAKYYKFSLLLCAYRGQYVDNIHFEIENLFTEIAY